MASQTTVASEHPPASGRNPYEMRLDLLHLAKSILENNAHMAREDKKNKAGDRQTWYTTDEVIKTAKRLNAFISNNA